MLLQSLLVALLLSGRGVPDPQMGACYTDENCTGDVIALDFFQSKAKDCCVGTSDGRSYSYDGDCAVRSCIGQLHLEYLCEGIEVLCMHFIGGIKVVGLMYILIVVHGFVNASYDVLEGDRLDIYFQLNESFSISGTIITMAGGTASEYLYFQSKDTI